MENDKCERQLNKEKRKLKHKKQEKDRHNSSSDSEISSQDEWVEARSTSRIVMRDDWMNTESFVPTLTKEEIRGGKRKKELQSLSTVEKPGQHDRELNPYWKGGGTGLPTPKTSTSTVSLPEKSVGDAGLNWLRRAYQRIEEQAKEENKSIEEVAAARWGSLEKLESLLKEAEAKAKGNKCFVDKYNSKSWRSGSSHKKHKKYKEEQEYSRSRKSFENNSRSNYNKRNRDADTPFQRPTEISEGSMQRRNFCWEGETEKAPAKRNWMKKETISHNPTKSLENESKESVENLHIQVKQLAEEPTELCHILSDKEMNELGAKLIKAEMLGRKDQAEQLKIQLNAARKARENAEPETFNDKTVVLVRTNDKGFCQPLSSSHYECSTETSKREFKEKQNKSRRKQVWLADNDKYSLRQMFEREKMTSSEDKNIEFANMFAKSGANDDDFDGFIANDIKEKSSAEQEQHDRNQAIQEHIRMSASLDKCYYCLESTHTKKHLIIAIGIKTYLSLPSSQSFTNGHCFIVPMSHISSGTLLDEDVWAEIKIFQKGLSKMFEEMGKVAIFIETSMHHRRHPHTVIECIPVLKEDGDMAPFYFKKAIMESETEWSHNKKLVDLYKKDLLHSVPKGLPYFSVQFGLEGGFAHVIEDEKLFPSYFGKEIIGGLLEMEPTQWRKHCKENTEEQTKKIVAFRKLWKPYDWTEKLKER